MLDTVLEVKNVKAEMLETRSVHSAEIDLLQVKEGFLRQTQKGLDARMNERRKMLSEMQTSVQELQVLLEFTMQTSHDNNKCQLAEG